MAWCVPKLMPHRRGGGDRAPRSRRGSLVLTNVDPEGMAQTIKRLAWHDPFLIEWSTFDDSIVTGIRSKTTPENARQDLVLFRDMIAAMRSAATTLGD